MSEMHDITTFGAAGMTHHAFAQSFKGSRGDVDALSVRLMDGGLVTLKREPSNRFDPNAIEVFVAMPAVAGGPLSEPMKLGYVPRQVALWLAKLLDAGIVVKPRVEYADLATGSVHITVSREV